VKNHVGGFVLGHFGLFVYVCYLSILLSKQSALAFIRVEQLSHDLQSANKALAEQNNSLELLVDQRTKQLLENEQRTHALVLENEQRTHALELENKQRDIEAVKINNQLKQEVSKTMIVELEIIQQSDRDLKVALKKFISEIKLQFGLGEKLNTLENGMNDVNAEFYDRLTSAYPQLTKMERELCSLIKLNLSNKEISSLLKTTPNALNVARSRLRKKLNMPQEMDLEVFIRKI
jgi:DNA-binding CsgD family transcriptional regulator